MVNRFIDFIYLNWHLFDLMLSEILGRKSWHWLAPTAEKDSQCKYVFISNNCRSTLRLHLCLCKEKTSRNPLAYSMRSSVQCRLFSAQLSSSSLVCHPPRSHSNFLSLSLALFCCVRVSKYFIGEKNQLRNEII